MEIQVQKWGNSLAIRIPKSFAIETHITNGSFVNLSLSEGKLIATPIYKKKYSLTDLMQSVSEDNIHEEIISGDSVGKEIW
jgi:antitoxin MazE